MIKRIIHPAAFLKGLCRTSTSTSTSRHLNFVDIFGSAAIAGNRGSISEVQNFHYADGIVGPEKSVCCYISAGASCRINNLLPQILTGFFSLNSYLRRVMGKAKAGGFYAVARGRSVGIFRTWDDCKAQVDGFPKARYKKFASSGEAEAFIEENRDGVPGSGSYKPEPPSEPGTAVILEHPATIRSGMKGANLVSLMNPGTQSFNNFPGTSTTTSTRKASRSGSSGLTRTIFLPEPHLIPPNPTNKSQKRSLSSTAFKVTEDRVVNKRSKLNNDMGNANSACLDLAKFTVDEDGYVVVFTDGACSKNGKKAAKAGIGVWFGHGHDLNISEPVIGRQTNNTAEIQAAERAIRQAKGNGINKLKIKTDSKFSINCVTKWLHNWKRNNWRLSSGGEVKNKEDIIKLDEAMQNMEIKWSYVAGHAGIEGNEAADRLAVAGAERA